MFGVVFKFGGSNSLNRCIGLGWRDKLPVTGWRQAAPVPVDFHHDWHVLDKRYNISQFGHDGRGDYLQHLRCDLYGFEKWLSQIKFFTKDLVDKDLGVVALEAYRTPNLITLLQTQLQWRSFALASLDQTGMPQPMKVLCLLLRELWETRITDGASKLAEQPTSTLQDLCKLIQNAMEDWENVKRRENWCCHFCEPLWMLRKSRGRGRVALDKAFKDLQVIEAEAQKIIAARLAAEQAAHPPSSEVPHAERQRQEIPTENNGSEVNQKLQGLKPANDSLKLQVVDMEEKFTRLEQGFLKCEEMCQNQQKVADELAGLKHENLKMQEEVHEMKSKNCRLATTVRKLEQDASQTHEVNEQQQGELQVMKEELAHLRNDNSNMKEELQELKLENESMKLRGLEVECRVNRLEESKTSLSKKLDEHVQKLEEERLRMKEELVDFKNDKLKMKEDLMECNSGKLKILVELNSDKLKIKEELQDLKSKYDQLKFKTIQSDISDVSSEFSSWVQIQQDAQASMLQSASSAFSVDTNGPRCFMLDALFKAPDGTFLTGTRLHLGFH